MRRLRAAGIHGQPVAYRRPAKRRARVSGERIRPGQLTMRGCSSRVGSIWRVRWGRATRMPVGRRRGSSWMSSVRLTGYTRKHALVLLGCPPTEDRPPPYRGRLPSYGSAEVALLRMCWSATDGICSKRLEPFLLELSWLSVATTSCYGSLAAHPGSTSAASNPAAGRYQFRGSRHGRPRTPRPRALVE